ncbi:unnamed protein product, partial [Meganyctiphanes norvegica]
MVSWLSRNLGYISKSPIFRRQWTSKQNVEVRCIHRGPGSHIHQQQQVLQQNIEEPTVDHPSLGPKQEIPRLNFGNHALAFRHKTTHELLRGLIVLQTCSIDAIVNRSYQMLKLGERLLGGRLLGVVTAPFYNQFVGGDTEQQMAATTNSMAELGIGLMICPMVESDAGEGELLHELFAKNLRKTLALVSIVSRNNGLSNVPGICQTKITAHLSADVMMHLHEAYEKLSFDERVQVVDSVAAAFVNKGITDCVPNFGPLQLDPNDTQEFAESLPRLYKIGRACVEENVVLAVDAEYTYVKTAINFISLAMMKAFNTDRTVVWNTYQGYLK